MNKNPVTAAQCWAKWGDPTTTFDEGKYLSVLDIPAELEIGVIPKKLYCNNAMHKPLLQAFRNLIDRGFVNELKTFDGCYNVRKMRGLTAMSLHSWAIAIDVNARWNALGATPTLSSGFVRCFTDAGFDWGGNWTRKDGMHFQLSKI